LNTRGALRNQNLARAAGVLAEWRDFHTERIPTQHVSARYRMPNDDSNPQTEGPQSDRAQAAFEQVRERLGQPIAYYRGLAMLTGSAKSALLLGQALYWMRHSRDIERTQGWFFKTTSHWRQETGLSIRELATVRRRLVALGVLEERRAGVPAKLYYRVNVTHLAGALHVPAQPGPGCGESSDVDRLIEQLGPASAFYPRIAAFTGGVHVALVLSRALILTKHARTDSSGWIAKSAAAWANELGLTLAQYRHARQCLSRLGVWQENLRGIPARIHVRVAIEALAAGLGSVSGTPAAARILKDDEVPASHNARSSLNPSADLVLRNPANQFLRSMQSSSAETVKLKEVMITKNRIHTPPPPCVSQTQPEPSAFCGEALIFPVVFSADERRVATTMLAAVSAHAQDLLDELAARMAINAVRTSPIGYLRALIERAKSGQFASELGSQVRAQRRQRAIDEALQSSRFREAQQAKAERESPQHQATLERRREDMHRFLTKARRTGGRQT
jgi:hypothetical protein